MDHKKQWKGRCDVVSYWYACYLVTGSCNHRGRTGSHLVIPYIVLFLVIELFCHQNIINNKTTEVLNIRYTI